VTIIQNTETNEVIQSNRLHVPLNWDNSHSQF